jgi:hypothetical protein
MSTEKEAKLKALQTLDKLDKTYGKRTMKMGDRAIVEVETISSGSLGIDLALELVVTQEEELLKYTAQSLKDYIDTSCYCRSSKKAAELLLLLMRSTHSTEIMLKN